MTDILEFAKAHLHNEDLSIAVVNEHSRYVSKERGISPLIKLIDENPEQLLSSAAADKVIGKAAALLMIYGGVKYVYADIISRPALETLKEHGITPEYKELVPYIINRDKTGMCPMEKTVLDIDDPSEAITALKFKLQELRSGIGK